ncbi:unnamed protein product [Closterium sp. NIES-53]
MQEDWDERASAGYYLMSQSLELNQRHHVMHLLPEVDCGPKAWTLLKELHAPTSVVATLMLERELSALRLSEGEPVQPVLDKMRDLYAKLATTGITYPEQTNSCDESLFLKGGGEKLVLFLVYVDDILLFSSSMKEIQNVQQQVMKNFKSKTLGEVKYYLGMHVERDLDHRWLKLHQEKFIKELGEKYGIENERKVATPVPAEFKLMKAAEDEGVEAEEQQQFQSLVGSLLYAAVHTRPDISFSVGQLARVVQNPSGEQVDAAERVVKYLNSHPSIGVQYSASAQVKQKGVEVLKEKGERLGEGKLFLTCFTDATWASGKDDSSSVGGYICVVGGGPVSWRSKKQTETALSSV